MDYQLHSFSFTLRIAVSIPLRALGIATPNATFTRTDSCASQADAKGIYDDVGQFVTRGFYRECLLESCRANSIDFIIRAGCVADGMGDDCDEH